MLDEKIKNEILKKLNKDTADNFVLPTNVDIVNGKLIFYYLDYVKIECGSGSENIDISININDKKFSISTKDYCYLTDIIKYISENRGTLNLSINELYDEYVSKNNNKGYLYIMSV